MKSPDRRGYLRSARVLLLRGGLYRVSWWDRSQDREGFKDVQTLREVLALVEDGLQGAPAHQQEIGRNESCHVLR